MVRNRTDNNFEVMVYVMTYNHEKYIRQCLDTIFSQKTEFRYVVAICDDFSTDSNRQIIEEYYRSHEDRCILIYEDFDQMKCGNYNFHIKNIQRLPKVKYVALAEGDDYFTDDYKLQMQYDALEKNKTCNVCYHATNLFDDSKNVLFSIIPSVEVVKTHKSGMLDNRRVTRFNITEGNIFSYNAYFFRVEYLYGLDTDNEFWNCWSGDLSLYLFFSQKGEIYYINKVMSVKRLNNDGSYSAEALDGSIKSTINSIKRTKACIRQLDKFDEMSEREYHEYIVNRILRNQLALVRLQGKVEGYIGYNGMIFKSKMMCRLSMHFYTLRDKFVKNMIFVVKNDNRKMSRVMETYRMGGLTY